MRLQIRFESAVLRSAFVRQVAKLVEGAGFEVDDSKPYAELWCVGQLKYTHLGTLLLVDLSQIAFPQMVLHAAPATILQSLPLCATCRSILLHTRRTRYEMLSTLCRMGTHPSGHAALASKQHLTLAEWLEDHPEALGQQVLQHFGTGLPFLLKV